MTTSTDTIASLLSRDALEDARTQSAAAVKAAPQDTDARLTLAQICAIAGDLPRAETHARMAQTLDEARTMALAEFRQYLRALEARAQWWDAGAVPDMPGGPTALDQLAMAGHVAHLAGDMDGAVRAATDLEEARPACTGTIDGTAFDDLRDVDDRLPHALEVLTPGGHYLWLDLSRVARVDLAPVAAPFDLIARPARVALRDGSTADLCLPAVYDAPRTAQEQLGRVTEFEELAPGLVRGYGQRAWLAGDDLVGLTDPAEITLDE
ncbi:type VI secretion system accessory protein TagJ [Jannaschia sp. CCS1]|uniref:type VI secretion system accessory protein TagJ n=1 Tax=Jannaschia sp. (strain CCS1) TaxID=290400 RepID=UPI000053B9CC|nr:type VI secretion system accessory protein TagJ [Jannaschia sp. CCS1]ABD55945.1 virulence protein SciE type [Jannaschia sp. CCS1]